MKRLQRLSLTARLSLPLPEKRFKRLNHSGLSQRPRHMQSQNTTQKCVTDELHQKSH